MRYLIMLLLAAGVTVVSTPPAQADLDDPLFKLLSDDGVVNDEFGYSVAISGTRAIIGAWHDGDNGSNSGSAYIFDTTTGQQLFKLLPNDGAAGDLFGETVSISGTRAIVGAYANDDDGNASGSAYIFDVTTGEQLFKLLAFDAAEGDAFGHSVAISGTRAIVGAWFDDDNGNFSGSAYIFDVTTGAHLHKVVASDGTTGDEFGGSVAIDATRAIVGADSTSKNTGTAYLFDVTTGQQIGNPLFASDPAEDDRFGASVAISGTRAIVGAAGNDDDGSHSGSAYLFDATTGQQIGNPLLADDAAAGDYFGISVAISGVTAIIGAYRDSDNGNISGSAYLFDATTGKQMAKLLPVDGEAGDQFGWCVAISGTKAIVGAPFDDNNGTNFGSVYLTADDADRDGLLDSWENNGIPYFDVDEVLQHYALPGANANHKDLYVEVDSMIGLGFAPAAQSIVIQAFANAPNSLIDNPDGLDGVNLHLLVDETDLDVEAFPNAFTDFDGVKVDHFGTAKAEPPEEPEQGNAPLLQAKAKAYRYCIFGSTYGGGTSSGLAERGGNDFMVTLGGWSPPGGTTNQKAGTFMHEFGHTLGLLHLGPWSEASPAELAGPDRHYNLKPNYYSIMNYDWQTPKAWHTPGSWPLAGNNSGYSRAALNTLDESDLDEIAGLVPAEHAAIYPAPGFLVPFNVETDPGLPPIVRPAVIAHESTVDWNDNGNPDPHDPGNPIARDVNRVRTGWPASPNTTLPGYDDWSFLDYDFKDSLFFADGEHADEEPDEMTFEDHQALDKILPPACVGDITLDGAVGAADLLQLLVAWGPCPDGIACVRDLDEDGNVGAADLLTLLVNWGPCPK